MSSNPFPTFSYWIRSTWVDVEVLVHLELSCLWCDKHGSICIPLREAIQQDLLHLLNEDVFFSTVCVSGFFVQNQVCGLMSGYTVVFHRSVCLFLCLNPLFLLQRCVQFEIRNSDVFSSSFII